MPARRRHPRPTHVFINCPFDKGYEKLFLALIAGLTGLGLTPRCVLEIRLEPRHGRLRAPDAGGHIGHHGGAGELHVLTNPGAVFR